MITDFISSLPIQIELTQHKLINNFFPRFIASADQSQEIGISNAHACMHITTLYTSAACTDRTGPRCFSNSFTTITQPCVWLSVDYFTFHFARQYWAPIHFVAVMSCNIRCRPQWYTTFYGLTTYGSFRINIAKSEMGIEFRCAQIESMHCERKK